MTAGIVKAHIHSLGEGVERHEEEKRASSAEKDIWKPKRMGLNVSSNPSITTTDKTMKKNLLF